MKTITKIFAISIIAIMLSSIPLTFANTGPDLIKVVNVLKVNDNNARPGGSGGGSGGKGTAAGYTLIANGLNVIPTTLYVKSSAEDSGFYTAIVNSIAEWNDHSPKQLFAGVTVDNTLTIETSASQVDGKDELAFGDLGTTGIIAQTTTWITRAGKQIVDFDIVFNTNFNWGNAGTTSETTPYTVNFMDTENIATHELGHGVGLGDLYQPQWSSQTMYGYSSEGVTWQRTLESGDIAGLQALYGR